MGDSAVTLSAKLSKAAAEGVGRDHGPAVSAFSRDQLREINALLRC